MDVFDGLSGSTVSISNVQASGFCGQNTISICGIDLGSDRNLLTVVGTVAARDQLLVLALHGEPSLEIVLDCSGIVKRSRNDLRDPVRKTQRLIESLRVLQHGLKHGGRVLGLSDAELFDLLELMHSEDTPGVPSVGPGLLSETGRVSGVPERVY